MKRFNIEVIGTGNPHRTVDADYMSNSNGAYNFWRNLENEPDKIIAKYPVNRTVINSIADLDNTNKASIFNT